MRTKKIKIKSKSEFDKELKTVAKAWDEGKRVKKVTGDFFESLEAVRKVLTEKRIGLWRIIRDQRPGSILELARSVHRDFRGVHRDVMLLVEMGLISLRSEKGKRGDVQRPISEWDALSLEVA